MPLAFGQQPTGAPSPQPTGAPPRTVWLYISTYTGAPGAGGNGQGIYLCALNLSTGDLNVVRLVAPVLPAAGPVAYRLGAGDQVRLITFGEETLTGEFRVSDSGSIADLVPEPASLALMGISLFGICGSIRRRVA